MTIARALQFRAPRQLQLIRVEVPEPSATQILVRTSYSGISAGTEMLAYRGELDPDMPRDEQLGALGGTFRYPFSYGYSCVGRVVRGSSDLPEGTPVFAFHPHQDLIAVETDDVVRLPDQLDLGRATVFPLVETALQISIDCGPVAHERIVVMGLGVVGLLTATLLQWANADVIGIEPNAERRIIAESFGVHAVNPAGARQAVGDGVPLVVDAAGAPDALAGALDLLAHEGTVVVASWYGTKPVSLPLGAAFHRRRLTIRSTQVSTIPAHLSTRWDVARRRRTALALLEQLPLERLPVIEVPLEEASKAYTLLDQGDTGFLHAVLRYE